MMSVCEKQVQDDTQNSFKQKNSPKFDSDIEDDEEIPEWMKSDETDANKAEEAGVPAEIAGWRRADTGDRKAIEVLQKLTGHVASTLYLKKDINELIGNCYFSIVQYDSKGRLVSFTAFDYYPNVPSTPLWSDWLSTNYKISGITPGNVLFIHYMVWRPEYEDKFLPLLLETSFAEFVRLKYIIIVKPPTADVPKFYTNYFFPLLPLGLEELENTSIQLLLLCLRSSIVKPLYIRIAFDQEIDIIMSVVQSSLKNGKLLNSSGIWDYVNFVYSKDKKTLICEIEGQLVGVMVLNLKFDLDVLNEGFELAPFNGLRKKDLTREEDIFQSDGYYAQEKASTKEVRSTNILMSSKLLLSPKNWEMSIGKAKPMESTLIASESHFSQFSVLKLSSTFDLKRSNEMLAHKNEFMSKMGAFCSNCKIDEKQSSFDFLEAAFRILPDIDYCILLTPTDSHHSPILDLFVRVTPRPLNSFKQELYLCHKNTLSIISMSVRRTKKSDLDDINDFLRFVDEGDTVYHDILTNCFGQNGDFKSFVLTLGKHIIGVSLIKSDDVVEHFHMYFEVSDFAEPCLRSNSSVIEHLVISPVYHNHARFFVRDIMRLVDVNGIYYVRNAYCKRDCNLLSILGEFVPVKPRKKAGSSNNSPSSEMDPFSLFFLSPRLCGFPKIHINIVIVVVGASQTAMSFLENLVFGPDSCYYNYNNLICVSPHGLEADDEEESVQDYMFPIRNNFSGRYVSMLALDAHVSFIHGVMTEINRSDKYIVVNNKSIIPYDYLVLTCGLQYLLPIPQAQVVSQTQDECKTPFKSSLSRFLRRSSETRSSFQARNFNNMFIVNTKRDALNALKEVQFLMQKIKKVNGRKIIVYGHDLHVFLTINTLLKFGIPGEVIVFVEPFPSGTTTVTLFNDYCVDQAVIESVKQCKVSYYTEYFLYDWSVSSEDYITSIKFHSKRKQMVIPCLAFFPFLEKLVSDVTFNACNDGGLVYDGRLVINHNFRTNDSSIYAAGSFTKYARRYFANEFNHQHYNSREVGKKLAEIIRERIDPTTVRKTNENSELVPRMIAPKFLHCQLPGEFNLFIVRKPGKELDLETAYNFTDYGEVLTTGDCKMKNGYGYFRVHLNPEGFVESITCYTKDEIDYVNLSCLYGLHERLLNNLLVRYDTAVIPDFFEYFRQPWALALFHDSFQRVRDSNYRAFFRRIFEDKNFYERVVEELELNNWRSLGNQAREQLESTYSNSRIQDDIKNNLFRFLEHFRDELPVYYNYIPKHQ